jgi:hypothetical protein
MADKKVKVTINVNKEVDQKAQNVLEKKNIPKSRAIESFLQFVADPHIYCFSCGVKFFVSKASVCPKCSFVKCTKCHACSCKLSEQTSAAVFHMRRVYEDLIGGRVK